MTGYLTSDDLRAMGVACGDGCIVSVDARIYGPERLTMGTNVRIDAFTILTSGTGHITLGSYIHIAPFCLLVGGGGIRMEDFTGLSSGVRVYSLNDDYSGGFLPCPSIDMGFRNIQRAEVTMRELSLVGCNSTIMPGVTMARGSVLFAHSLLTKSTEEYKTYHGVTAKRVGTRSRRLEHLADAVRNGESPAVALARIEGRVS